MKKHLLLLLFAVPAVGFAQVPGTAKWEAIAQPLNKQGVLVVNLTAQIEKGWHIYALSQPPGGPIPLRIAVEPGTPYELAGNITGAVPQKHRDPSFNLETQFYTDSFTLKVPVKATSGVGAAVPLAVRFQMCSDTTCMPPKTVHLVATATSPSALLK
jgi:DsbC/DsbD-like thiol-disulfide interchange protein